MIPTIHTFADADALAAGAARFIADRIADRIVTQRKARVVLSGGSTPVPMYEHWARRDMDPRIRWDRIRVFFTDERAVPADDPQSNFKTASDAFLSALHPSPKAVHRIAGEIPTKQAAVRYNNVLAERGPMDIVILGMGEDGHTASLFKGEVDPFEDRLAVAATSPNEPKERVTLTLRCLNEAREVFFVIQGAEKADRLAEVYQQLHDPSATLPAAMIRPDSGVLHWLIDAAAASKLPPAALRAR
ncbi:MAG: 6-phosphogluconolactonase [Myxococcota bacterium]|jgi:6-phosphogluconolactonase